MKKITMKMLVITFFLLTGASAAHTQEMSGPQRPQGRMKPPQEAVNACKGKSEGAAVQFTTSRGDTLKGICRQMDGVLSAVPERGSMPSPQGRP